MAWLMKMRCVVASVGLVAGAEPGEWTQDVDAARVLARGKGNAIFEKAMARHFEKQGKK